MFEPDCFQQPCLSLRYHRVKTIFHNCAYSCQASFWLLSQNTSCWRPPENRMLSPTVLKAEKCKPQAWAEPVSATSLLDPHRRKENKSPQGYKGTKPLSPPGLSPQQWHSDIDFTWGILKVTNVLSQQQIVSSFITTDRTQFKILI